MDLKKTDVAKIWFFRNIKEFGGGVSALTAISILINVAGVGFAIASQRLLDVASKAMNGNLLKEAGILVFLVVLQLVLQIILSKCYVKTGAQVRIKIKTEEKILRQIYKIFIDFFVQL